MVKMSLRSVMWSLWRWVRNSALMAPAPDATGGRPHQDTPATVDHEISDGCANQGGRPGSIGVGQGTSTPEDDDLHGASFLRLGPGDAVAPRHRSSPATLDHSPTTRRGELPPGPPTSRPDHRAARFTGESSFRPWTVPPGDADEGEWRGSEDAECPERWRHHASTGHRSWRRGDGRGQDRGPLGSVRACGHG